MGRNAVRPRKERYGYEVYSTGSIQRALASEMGLTTLEMNELMFTDVKYDRLIDNKVLSLSRNAIDKTIVFDSRMAWKFAENSIKVFLTIDPLEAASRVLHTRNNSVESYSSIYEAKEMLIRRSQLENERFKKIYNVDIFDYRNYDLVLDTTYISSDTACDIIYRVFMEKSEKKETRIVLSPKMLYPTQNINEIKAEPIEEESRIKDGHAEGISIIPFNGYNFIVSGHKYWLDAIIENRSIVETSLVDVEKYSFWKNPTNVKNYVASINNDFLKEFEELGGFQYLSYPIIR